LEATFGLCGSNSSLFFIYVKIVFSFEYFCLIIFRDIMDQLKQYFSIFQFLRAFHFIIIVRGKPSIDHFLVLFFFSLSFFFIRDSECDIILISIHYYPFFFSSLDSLFSFIYIYTRDYFQINRFGSIF
jgi:hypothetical protein